MYIDIYFSLIRVNIDLVPFASFSYHLRNSQYVFIYLFIYCNEKRCDKKI